MDFLFPPQLGVYFIIATWIITAIIHIAFAAAVFSDSQMMMQRTRRSTFLVGGGFWALATLLGGVFVAAIYWAIHHSTLRPPSLLGEDPAKPEVPGTPDQRPL